MLKTTIDNTRHEAKLALEAAIGIGREEPAAHAGMVLDRLVPDADALRIELLEFARRSIEQVRAVLETGRISDSKALFSDLAGGLGAFTEKLGGLQSAMATARAVINADHAAVQVDLARLHAVVVEKVAHEQALRDKVRDNALIASLTWLSPIAKLVSTIVSVAKDGGPTELVLVQAIQELEQVRDEAARMDAALRGLTQLGNCTTMLGEGLQGLVLGVALTQGHMRNAANDLEGAPGVELFCRTAVLDLEDLERQVAA